MLWKCASSRSTRYSGLFRAFRSDTFRSVLLLGFAEAQFNSTACSASQAAPVDSSVLPWGGTGLKIFNDIAKQTTVAVLETEPGLGTALGIVATLLWPTPSQSNSSVPACTILSRASCQRKRTLLTPSRLADAIQQCALQYAVNQVTTLALVKAALPLTYLRAPAIAGPDPGHVQLHRVSHCIDQVKH